MCLVLIVTVTVSVVVPPVCQMYGRGRGGGRDVYSTNTGRSFLVSKILLKKLQTGPKTKILPTLLTLLVVGGSDLTQNAQRGPVRRGGWYFEIIRLVFYTFY